MKKRRFLLALIAPVMILTLAACTCKEDGCDREEADDCEGYCQEHFIEHYPEKALKQFNDNLNDLVNQGIN